LVYGPNIVSERPPKIELDEAYINEKLDEAIAAVDSGQVVPCPRRWEDLI
jgi:hypothetical protein